MSLHAETVNLVQPMGLPEALVWVSGFAAIKPLVFGHSFGAIRIIIADYEMEPQMSNAEIIPASTPDAKLAQLLDETVGEFLESEPHLRRAVEVDEKAEKLSTLSVMPKIWLRCSRMQCLPRPAARFQ